MFTDRLSVINKIESRNFNYFIPKKEIRETIFNGEIKLGSLFVRKDIIPDWISFYIAAMGTVGLDEFDMVNTQLTVLNKDEMLKEILKFQEDWKLKLEIDEYLEENIQHSHRLDMDPNRKNHDSEISYIIETEKSFILFFTEHLYY